MQASGEVTAVYRQYCLDSIGALSGNGSGGSSVILAIPTSTSSSLEAATGGGATKLAGTGDLSVVA